ncbi:MAG: 16S rRNA (cytosine(1402)-N(4))-methyltransferase RsmH, partial [Oscillospiraceae bacterium]
MEFNHISVLFDECMNGLAIRSDGIYIDGTAGGAGHSAGIASRLTTGKLIALDKDPDAVKIATERLSKYKTAQVIHGDFADIPMILDNLGIDKVDGILLDLGVSSHQLDTAERGFSYHNDAPLDMRMAQSGKTAYDVVNTYSHGQLTRIMRDYGEERFASRIAANILKDREIKPIETTLELVEIIKRSIPAAKRREGGHPAKRAFQAIRIEVNGELEHLEHCLD